MANEKKRITQLPTAPQVEDNDYIALDNTSTPSAENDGGTRKILVKDITAKSADAVEYDNTTSGLEADNVQEAIDEVLEEGGKVQDVKVNGVSVLDNNKTAQIVSYKEVTQAQYDALPSSKLTDGIMYCIKDAEFSAEDVPYDNSDSGLASEDVQSAVDEIADVLGALKVEGTVENAQIATFTDGSALPMPKLEVAIEPIQEGSGDPSPTNIRPIIGWSECKPSVAGKNLVNWKWNTFNDGKMEIFLKGGTYTLSAESTLSNGNAYIRGTKPSGEYVSREELGLTNWGVSSTSGVYYGGGGQQTYTFNIPNGGAKIEFGKLNNNGTISAQLEFGSTATDYEPYNGQTYTIDLDGTRYGGTLDVLSGVMVVDRVGVDLGSLTWIYDQSLSRFYSTPISDKRAGLLDDDEIMCSCFRPNGAPVSGASIDGTIAIWDRCYVKWFELTDATVFKERVTGQTFTYPLATPLTIQLTPTQVNSLEGVNNISADCGKINKAVYIRDLNIVINNLLNG